MQPPLRLHAVTLCLVLGAGSALAAQGPAKPATTLERASVTEQVKQLWTVMAAVVPEE